MLPALGRFDHDMIAGDDQGAIPDDEAVA